MKQASKSLEYCRVLQQVVRDMGVPPRGPKGSWVNSERKRLWPSVIREANRRWEIQDAEG